MVRLQGQVTQRCGAFHPAGHHASILRSVDSVEQEEGYDSGSESGYESGYEDGKNEAWDEAEAQFAGPDPIRDFLYNAGIYTDEPVTVQWDAALNALVWTQGTFNFTQE